MPLSAGTRLGPYGIFAPLGTGGMGEVYRARDTKLKRDVALDVLPEAFARPIEGPTKAGGNIGALSRHGNRILVIAGDETDEVKHQILTDWTVLLGGPHE